ncbi:MAG: ribbon-helix-helix protein, CopG family [Thermoplasmatales archaeon]|jgi:Arc/MetJ-type ribon-helix-helix transcriptional regulator|nr:ribbon-helix-helix protein, CopG family [Thermoplasmatales archaeon]
MADTRLTLRLSMQDIQIMDMFLRSGEFSSRSEFIRRAIREYQQSHMEEIIKKAEAVKKLQNIVDDIELGKEYLEP